MYNIFKIFASLVSIFAIPLRPSEITLAKDLEIDQEILSWHLTSNDNASYKKAIFSKETKEAKAQREWHYWRNNADQITLPIKLDLLSKAADNLLVHTDLQESISTLFNSIPGRVPKSVYAQKIRNMLAQTFGVQSNIQHWCNQIIEQPTIQARIALKNQLLKNITNKKMRDHIEVLVAEHFAQKTINQLGLYTITDTSRSISRQGRNIWNPSGRDFKLWHVSHELQDAVREGESFKELRQIYDYVISYLQDTTHDREILVLRNNESIRTYCADREKNIAIKECNIDYMNELNNFSKYYICSFGLEGLFYHNRNFLIDSYVDYTNSTLYFLENNNSLIKLYAYNYQKNTLMQLDQLSYKIGNDGFLENIPINNICEMKFLNNGKQIGIELSHAGATKNTWGGFSFAVYDSATQRYIIDTAKNRFTCRYVTTKSNGFLCTSGDDGYGMMPVMELVPATLDEVLLQDIIENGSFTQVYNTYQSDVFKKEITAQSPTILFLAQYKQLFLRCAHLKSHQRPINENEVAKNYEIHRVILVKYAIARQSSFLLNCNTFNNFDL